MKKDLKTIRAKWEKTLSVKSVLDFEDRTIVILENEENKTYHIHRYFLLGGDWACSVDSAGISLDEVFQCLEYIVK